jgi:hypothetical protein
MQHENLVSFGCAGECVGRIGYMTHSSDAKCASEWANACSYTGPSTSKTAAARCP